MIQLLSQLAAGASPTKRSAASCAANRGHRARSNAVGAYKGEERNRSHSQSKNSGSDLQVRTWTQSRVSLQRHTVANARRVTPVASLERDPFPGRIFERSLDARAGDLYDLVILHRPGPSLVT